MLSRKKTTAAKPKKRLLLPLALAALCTAGYYYAYKANTQLKPILPPLAAKKHLQQWLIDDPSELLKTEAPFHLTTVSDIYRRTGYKPLWIDNYQLSDNGEQLLQQLQETSADQRSDYNYHLTYLQQRLRHLPSLPREATALDILLTDAFISYANDVLSDRLLPGAGGNDHPSVSRPGLRPVNYHLPLANASNQPVHNNIVQLFEQNASPYKLGRILASMIPNHQQYLQLRNKLNRYLDLLHSDRWQPIDSGPILRAGQSHPHIAQLRRLLRQYGDYPLPRTRSLFDELLGRTHAPTNNTHPDLFDPELEQSLKRFQARHAQKVDGILGRDSRATLNVNPDYRVKQIALNMKRWRQLPKDLGERYIWVNMTDYQLQLVEKDETQLAMKVIIGKSYRRTPVLQEKIYSLVLNPHWNVPRRIALYDILPKARKNPDYLRSGNFHIFDGWDNPREVAIEEIDWSKATARNFPYRLQQAASPNNALGRVKFVLPNDQSIYLHDTSHPELFEQEFRALSSGCIRVEKPLQLANALLDGKQGWDMQQIDKALAAGKTQHLRLPEAVPTYLMYWTSWVDDKGVLQFRDDIYGRDQLNNRDPINLETLIL